MRGGLALTWLLALVATTAGLGVANAATAAVLVTVAVLVAQSIVGGPAGVIPLLAPRWGWQASTRAIRVLRCSDPDAAGRPRPRAPSA